METRIRVGEPGGHMRNKVFTLHGHRWQRDPYVCPGSSHYGLAGKCLPTDVPSQGIGDNPLGFYRGAQEGIGAGSHFDVVLESAGGPNAVPGDYLINDEAAFGSFAGSWGILRVGASAASPIPPVTGVALSASPGSPSAPGTAVTFTASAVGGSGSYEYEFLGRAAGSATWSVAQSYGPSPSWTWSGVAGSWEIRVNARSAGSASAAEATQTIPYAIQ
jgi:hypothetical protein